MSIKSRLEKMLAVGVLSVVGFFGAEKMASAQIYPKPNGSTVYRLPFGPYDLQYQTRHFDNSFPGPHQNLRFGINGNYQGRSLHIPDTVPWVIIPKPLIPYIQNPNFFPNMPGIGPTRRSF